MNKKSASIPIIVAISVVVGFILGQGLGFRKTEVYNNQNVFGTKLDGILDVIETRYVDSIDRNAFIEQAIDEILHKLDPHSAYVPA